MTEVRALDDFELVDGFVPAVVEVTGLGQLERLLASWLQTSDRPTVGAAGSRPGSPIIRVTSGSDKFDINRDTKRQAVREFLKAATLAGGAVNLPWHVVANERGRLNRVSYRADDQPTPGWYAYLTHVANRPRPLDRGAEGPATRVTHRDRIIQALRLSDGPLDDDQLSQRTGIEPRQSVNQMCRRLEAAGILRRYVGPTGKIVNELQQGTGAVGAALQRPRADEPMAAQHQADRGSMSTNRRHTEEPGALAPSTAGSDDKDWRPRLKTALNWLAVAFGILTGVQAILNDSRGVLKALGICIGTLAFAIGVSLLIRHRSRRIHIPLWMLVIAVLTAIALFIFFTLLFRR